MAYPRNAASPERIAVGAVVQISDGAIQTSGVSIAVRGQGGASGAGGGTTAYDNGIVEYTPTQGETDFTSFVVIAYKTGCIPVSQTIVTSASATAGYSGVDWSKVTAPTSTVGLTNTTVGTVTTTTTATNVTTVNGLAANVITNTSLATSAVDEIVDATWDEAISGHLTAGTTGLALNNASSAGDPWGTAVPGAYGAGTAGYVLGNNLNDTVTSRMATYTQPTGFLAATFPTGTIANTTNITAGTVTTATNVTTVNGLAANVITAASMAADASAEIADAVWDEDATGHQTQGTFGQAIGDPVADTGTIFKATVTDATGVTVGTDTATLLTRLGTPSDLGGGATISANLSDIEAETDDIGAAGAGLTAVPWNAAWDAEVQSEVADALAVYDPPTEAEMNARTLVAASYATAASITTIDDFLDTEIAAILALLNDGRTEPTQGAPPVSPNLVTKIDYLYKAWRNRSTQTATTYILFADDGTTADQKSTVSDDGTTYVRGEVVSGP